MNHSHRGFIVPLVLILFALFLVGGGAYVYEKNKGEQSTAVEHSAQATSTIPSTTPTSAMATTSESYGMISSLLDHTKASSPDVASIQRDYGPLQKGDDAKILYENTSRIYFVPARLSEGCDAVHYLDKVSLEYYVTGLNGCPELDIKETKPWYIEGPKFANIDNNSPLYAINLDTDKGTVIYAPSENESLLAGYFGDFGQPDMSIKLIDQNRVSIGIFKRYKNVSEITAKNQYGDLLAQKIRDEIVDFRKQ